MFRRVFCFSFIWQYVQIHRIADHDKLLCAYIGSLSLRSVRHTAHFVRSRLDAGQAYDAELGNLYQERLQEKTDHILKAYSQLSDQMIACEQELEPENDTTAIQRVAWLEFCRLCLQKFEAVRDDLNADTASFKSIDTWQDRELDSLLGRYLNAKYRYHLIEGLEEASPSDDAA